MLYQRVFDKNSCEFRGILQDFTDLLEFRGSMTTQNIRSLENPLQRYINPRAYT